MMAPLVNDQYQNQMKLEANYCGRFTPCQMAMMFLAGMLILFGGLPLLCFKVIPYLGQLVAGLL